tara:strand:- start:803 stop:1126 length:324 start_codon:yes stop_codon:yes gene_type:complete
MGFWSKFVTFFTPPPVVKVDEVKKAKVIKEAVKEATVELDKFEKPIKSAPKRARNQGRYVADDKSTPDVNEAWVGGKAPKKKTSVAKKKIAKAKAGKVKITTDNTGE